MKHSRGKTGTIRRVIKQASICLLLGAIVNVVVAWGFAWFTPSFTKVGEYRKYKQYDVMPTDDEFIGAILDVWEDYFPSDMNKESFPPKAHGTYGNRGIRLDSLYSYSENSFSVDMYEKSLFLNLVQTGFPMNCLSYQTGGGHSTTLQSP